MKRSVFTTLFEEEGGGTLAFNTRTSALAKLDDTALKALLDPGESATDQDDLDELEEAGFLVHDDVDEEADLAARFLADMNRTDFLSLCIAPTMACNLRCVYCYEEHERLRMSAQVEAAVLRFIERRYARHRFSTLEIFWYGGEPMLEFELVRRLSERMIAWCAEHGAAYRAHITTNATLVDDEAAAELARLRVVDAMPTLDGLAETHDARRVRIDGSGSFDATRAGIRALAKAGIEVGVNCNLDWANEQGYRTLRDELPRTDGCVIYASHLRNYGGWCAGCGEGSAAPRCAEGSPAAKQGGDAGASGDLMAREAYAAELFKLYAEEDPSAESLIETLTPRRFFCHGKMASYFVIDPEGNVCHCDGFMRDPGHVLFNVLDDGYELDWPQTRTLYERNSRCRGCAIMPLCLGDCEWEWSMFRYNCSALKTTLGDYVGLLAAKLEARECDGETEKAGRRHVRMLLPPREANGDRADSYASFASDGIM